MSFILRWLLATLFGLLLTVSAGTDQLQEAEVAYQDAAAAYHAGDYAIAFRLLRPLADQGLVEAQYNLAHMYYFGKGVPQNYAEAVKWYRMAADQGLAEAQYDLAHMYYFGKGVPQNHAEAVQWYHTAALQGLAKAQYGLGAMYVLGEGVPRDYVQAHMWFNLAAARSDADDRKEAVAARDRVASVMTPEQIAEAQALASNWKPKGE